MVRFLKEICRFVYGELTEPAAALEPLRKELKQVMEPLKGREDFEEPVSYTHLTLPTIPFV